MFNKNQGSYGKKDVEWSKKWIVYQDGGEGVGRV